MSYITVPQPYNPPPEPKSFLAITADYVVEKIEETKKKAAAAFGGPVGAAAASADVGMDIGGDVQGAEGMVDSVQGIEGIGAGLEGLASGGLMV